MALVDPKNYQPKDDGDASMAALLKQMAQMQQETARLLLEMKQSGSSGNAGAIEKLLDQQEQLLVKTRPENLAPPQISCFNPEGDRDHPRPELKCKFVWCGADETWETLTREEIELRNRLEPGDYMVTKANGNRIPFKVSGKRTESGAIEQMTVWYPCKDEHKADHMPNTAYLRQVLGEAIPSTADLIAELAKLRAELETAKAGAARV